MKIKFSVLIVISVIIGVVASLVSVVLVSQAASELQARKIVVFKSGVNEPDREALVKKFGGVKVKDLNLIGGKVAFLSAKAEGALSKQAGVLRIDDDVEVFALAKAQLTPSQVLPWGVDKIDAERVWPSGNTADPIKVAIIDTGISVSHPDLKNNIKGGVNIINSRKSWDDDNGHGSHVAGIVAGIDNTIGVVGVAPSADLYAVKVLNSGGSGYLSDIIEGLDWAIKNKMQVVNMSFGASIDIQSFHEAIQRANITGIVQVAAAGNSGGSVIFPAAYPEVIAVSATDNTDTLATWSSRGPEVDLSAPGVSIYSTYKGSTYATLSGTSMASPHVAGAAALVMNTLVGVYDADNDGVWDPSEVQKKLQDKATDLGMPGFDNLYGWGLVNAYQAVQ